MDFQVRSEETGIRYFPTLKQAYEDAHTDTTVWKISFDTKNGERVRLVRHDGHFVYQPIELL